MQNIQQPLQTIFFYLFSWLILGLWSVILRFGYIVLQELVHFAVHTLNAEGYGHLHQPEEKAHSHEHEEKK